MSLSKDRFQKWIFHYFGDDDENVQLDSDGNGAWIVTPEFDSYHIENKPDGVEVEGYGEQGFAEQQLNSKEIERITNEVAKTYGLEQSHYESHVHGARLYLHTKETVPLSKVFDVMENIGNANVAVANALYSARRMRGLTKEQEDAEKEEY